MTKHYYTPTNIELLEAALIDLQDVMEYVASESGDCNILNWLGPIEDKLKIIINRYTKKEE